MTMPSKKILVVFGATGGQGGSVVQSFLSDRITAFQFTVKAVTRDPSKPSAQALVAKGAETVVADLSDKSSLRPVLKGAYAVFSVTKFWEHCDADKERQQGKNVADVSQEVGIQHLIWSTVLSVTKLSHGALTQCHHFDSKADVEDYIRTLPSLPATFFLAGFFMSIIPGKTLRPSPQPPHTYTLNLPIPPATTPIPMLNHQDDTGKFVKAILLNREKTLGKRILGATAYYTPAEIVDTFREVKPEAGKGAQAVEIGHDVFKAGLGKAGVGEAVQEELLQNFRLLSEFGYFGGEGLEESHKILSEPLTTWKEYVQRTPVFADLK